MAKQRQNFPIILRWSDHVPASDVQDPLGLGLRGAARLASRLLYCITSITPRGRYYSFIPWCIYDFRRREKGKPFALGLTDSIILREQALTLACIAHHDGESCKGGGLVGSRDARKWFGKGKNHVDFRKLKKFAKNPALSAYLNSLVNLGFFSTDISLEDTDEETSTEEFSFDEVELSALGVELARRYDSSVGNLIATRHLGMKERSCAIPDLAKFGKHGGLCELSHKESADRDLLRDILFSIIEMNGESHRTRRRSLLLILELCRQISADGWVLNEPAFAGAVYFGAVVNKESGVSVVFPSPLEDIARRWRMYYFHYYMSVALEGLFAWLVSQLESYGLTGATIESLVDLLNESAVRKTVSDILQTDFKGSFGDLSPSTLLCSAGIPDGALDERKSQFIDQTFRSMSPFAEDRLEGVIRSNEHLYSPVGLALPMILLTVTLARYVQWAATNYGMWLASAANDPYLDLVPPLLTTGLSRGPGLWWESSWKELAKFTLSRYVIQQHMSMSYEKSRSGDRCLLQVDGQKVFSAGVYDKIGLRNPRLGSAIQILTDLALMTDDKNGVTSLTIEGKQFLKREILKEGVNEVS